VQDLIDHANEQIQQLASNFKRMETNAESDGNKLLQALKIQSNDPEALLALVTESKLAIAAVKPAGIDVSSCEDGNDQKYQAMVQEAGEYSLWRVTLSRVLVTVDAVWISNRIDCLPAVNSSATAISCI
jgi:hypothetical protein